MAGASGPAAVADDGNNNRDDDDAVASTAAPRIARPRVSWRSQKTNETMEANDLRLEAAAVAGRAGTDVGCGFDNLLANSLIVFKVD